jgi:tetratricopeptide (TPR) repeat protein
MKNPQGKLALAAQVKLVESRATGDAVRLAESLEEFASALLKEADVVGAAEALEEAAKLWTDQCCGERQGSCLLLAASSRRLVGDLDGAKQNLVTALAADIPRKIRNGLQVEWCEQELTHGRYESAHEGFTRIIVGLAEELNPIQQAQLYQRRAAAAVAAKRWIEAAEDLLRTSTIYKEHDLHADAEASALAAAAVLADVDTTAAERIVTELSQSVAKDGTAATRWGLVGGKVATEAGDHALALKRFDDARQGALDVGDTVSYLVAAVSASRAAECLGDFETAYARLATGWVSLSDPLGATTACQLMRPELEALRDRLGEHDFMAAKRAYEQKQHAHTQKSSL